MFSDLKGVGLFRLVRFVNSTGRMMMMINSSIFILTPFTYKIGLNLDIVAYFSQQVCSYITYFVVTDIMGTLGKECSTVKADPHPSLT